MQPYANLSGQSGVKAYQIGSNYIIVEFKFGRETFYKYTYSSASNASVEHMKNLAIHGRGLNTFVSTKPQPNYFSKSSTLAGLV